MPYHKSVEDTRDSFGFSLSRMTIHRYAKDEASDLTVERKAPVDHCVIQLTALKCLAQSVILSLVSSCQLAAHPRIRHWCGILLV